MNWLLLHTIATLDWRHFSSAERKSKLQPLIDYIRHRLNESQPINLTFVCTHNSRRSHLAQVWAQVAAAYFEVRGVYCYSGGTAETALFPKIAETLQRQGFHIKNLSSGSNPVYAIRYGLNELPVLGFSKMYNHPFNPVDSFAAVMTCSTADAGCPFVPGAEKRISVTFDDPKDADGTPEQNEVYASRSLQIATEMFYVFSQIQSL